MVSVGQSSTSWGGSNAGGKAKFPTPGKAQENDQTNGKNVGGLDLGKNGR